MGLLTEGNPLEWNETKQNADLVKKMGAKQFINIYHKFKDTTGYPFKWGDELEFSMVKFDHINSRVYLLLNAENILDELNSEQSHEAKFHPEYASYMVEAIPGRPFDKSLDDLRNLDIDMKNRRKIIQNKLKKDEHCMSITNFPRLGCKDFTWPNYEPNPINGITKSLFFPDEAIFNGHPRFKTLSKNIRLRRKDKPAVYVPIFRDKLTQLPFKEDNGEEFKDEFIYLDAPGFGMGCCCVQVTFQTDSMDEARYLYDNLATVCPILLALSGASPIWRGLLSDVDCRWNVISGSVDDRTKEELGENVNLNDSTLKINKSRYDSIDSYLTPEGDKYNDIDLVKNDQIFNDLLSSNMDRLVAQHIAHLFIRDPLVLFKEKLMMDSSTKNENDMDHFENIQSTNWQTMRFKPPVLNESIGWRVEFRPIELQLTDFENSAFCVFVILLARAIIKFKLNLLIPISKVDLNMKRAQVRNACREEKFYFRRNIEELVDFECDLIEMSLNEIINGDSIKKFPGLIYFIRRFLSEEELVITRDDKIEKYLKLIESRANGSLLTLASWIRKFVSEHPEYKKDSYVSERINYDLLLTMNKISNNEIQCPDLLDPNLLS